MNSLLMMIRFYFFHLNFICNSLNCSSETVDGESSIRETALAVLGNAITSRIEFSPSNIIAIPLKEDRSIKVTKVFQIINKKEV